MQFVSKGPLEVFLSFYSLHKWYTSGFGLHLEGNVQQGNLLMFGFCIFVCVFGDNGSIKSLRLVLKNVSIVASYVASVMLRRVELAILCSVIIYMYESC